MSVLVDNEHAALVQGISGKAGAFHTKQMVEYGTNVVAGVTPGKGGTKVAGLEQVPMFDTVAEAVEQTGANATVDLRAAAVRRRRDPRGRRRGHRARSSASPRAFRRSTWSSVKCVLDRDYPDAC